MHATIEGGYMRKFAAVAPDSQTFVIFSEKQVMGWALVFSHRGRHQLNVCVNPRYRRRGVARVLVREALRTHRNVIVLEWDGASRKFFRTERDRYSGRIKVVDWFKVRPAYQRLVRTLERRRHPRP